MLSSRVFEDLRGRKHALEQEFLTKKRPGDLVAVMDRGKTPLGCHQTASSQGETDVGAMLCKNIPAASPKKDKRRELDKKRLTVSAGGIRQRLHLKTSPAASGQEGGKMFPVRIYERKEEKEDWNLLQTQREKGGGKREKNGDMRRRC